MAQRRVVDEVVSFVGVALGTTWVAEGLAYAAGGSGLLIGVLPLMMFLPAVSAFLVQGLVVRRPLFRTGELGLVFGRLRWWFAGPALALVLVTVGFVVGWWLRPHTFAGSEGLVENLRHVALDLSGVGILEQVAVVASLNLLLAPVLNLPLFLGEEIGWRGFLVPRLQQLLGKNGGTLVGGAVWGVWHAPLILAGYNYPGHPLEGLVLMTVLCVTWGFLLQWTYERSRSIVVPALAHGMLNWSATTLGNLFNASGSVDARLDGPTGLIGIASVAAPIALFVGLLRVTKFRRTSERGQR